MATRAPFTEAEKEYIHVRKHKGATLAEIAHELDRAWGTARKWWRHQAGSSPLGTSERQGGAVIRPSGSS